MVYRAIQASIEAHKNQTRKLENGVYVAHPLEVAIILAQNGADEDVISAGILHDTVEDTSMSLDEIRNKFGDKVANIVEGCTEPDKTLSWTMRKTWAIQHLSTTATHEMRLVICADKLSNIRSIYRNLNLSGNKIWSHFHAPYKGQKWYYESMLKGLETLSGMPMYEELKALVAKVFNTQAKI